MKIFLCQYLCPQRHCVIASVYSEGRAAAKVEKLALAALKELKTDPWCGICGSSKLTFEHRELPFTDMATALKATKRVHFENMLTRMALRAQGKMFKPGSN